jgi:uncharacterized protein (TIRG00374 family)
MFATGLINKVAKKVFVIMDMVGYKKTDKFREKWDRQLVDYTESAKYVCAHKNDMIKIMITSLIQVAMYNLIPYCVCLSLGISDVHVVEMLLMQAMLNISVSMIPVPGTIGTNEGVFTWIYAGIFGASLVGPAMLIVRLINYYIPVLITGFLYCADFNVIKTETKIKTINRKKTWEV